MSTVIRKWVGKTNVWIITQPLLLQCYKARIWNYLFAIQIFAVWIQIRSSNSIQNMNLLPFPTIKPLKQHQNKNSRYFHFSFSPQNCLLGVGLEFIYTQHYAITFCFFPWLTVSTVYGIRLYGCMVGNVELWVFSLYCFCCSYSFFNSWRREIICLGFIFSSLPPNLSLLIK